MAAPGALLRTRGDENLNLGLRADHGADVAAVEHRTRLAARRGRREVPLVVEQGGAHLWNGGHHRSGLAAERPVTIDDAAPIETSFPGFARLLTDLGANIEAGDEAS